MHLQAMGSVQALLPLLYKCQTQRPQPIFAKKSERPAKMSDFPSNCVMFVVYGGVRTINGNIRAFINNIQRKFRKFCMRRSNLCGSKAKMRETHTFCVRVEVSANRLLWQSVAVDRELHLNLCLENVLLVAY